MNLPSSSASLLARLFHAAHAEAADVPRGSIVGVALGLGVFLYAITASSVFETWPDRWLFTAWVASLSGVGMFVLTARRGQQMLSVGMALAAAALNGSITANIWPMAAMDPDSAGAQELLVPGLLACGVLWVMAVSWANAWLDARNSAKNHAQAHIYPHLFQHAWGLFPLLGTAQIFVLLTWAVLALTAGLFSLLGLEFVQDWLLAPLSVFAISATLGGLGIAIVRAQTKSVAAKLHVVLVLAHVLTPLIAVAIGLVAAAVLVRGVELLWRTGFAAALLMGLQAFMILFINGVYQDGEKTTLGMKPYSRPTALLVHAALLVLPLLGVLAVWGIGLRVQQYGWTQERIWAMVAAAVLLAYSSSYALAALGSARTLLSASAANLQEKSTFLDNSRIFSIAWANRWLSVAVMVLLVALNTDWAAPARLAAQSQAARLEQTSWPFSEQTQRDFRKLRFDHGRWGIQAIERIRQSEPIAANAQAQAWLQSLAQSQSRYDSVQAVQALVWTREELPKHVAIAPGHTAPVPALWDAIWNDRFRRDDCMPDDKEQAQQQPKCVLLHMRLRVDRPQPLPLLCQLHTWSARCHVFEPNAQGVWQRVRELDWRTGDEDKQSALNAQIRAGHLRAAAPAWVDAQVQGFEDVHLDVENVRER